MRVVLVAAFLAALPVTAWAGCDFATGPCSTDSRGNTYRTEQGFGGGYVTTRNGQPYSTTQQTNSGNWREERRDGGSSTYNYNPYKPRR